MRETAYFELCDSVYDNWKSYIQTYFSTTEPYTKYWESLQK